ncbi:hypothetical protein [Chiayiivirga flava]|uniref:DUF3971 domain-containing protein n=1 Tax=Chiayiivirga flava TaxID=659595 RepID=A0A7W8D837_9GAMM|nr:hypothetical protein [Chiayiivirga flava]MBB5208502.1 hypothetical protein [Chiayiivirga flava]
MARGPARRTARCLVVLVLVLYGAYLVAANLFINSPLAAPLLNRKPERFTMDWSWGLSAWPGQVVLWDLHLRGQARHIVWSVEAGRASGYIAALPFARRTLRVPLARASDLRVAIERVPDELPPAEARDNGFVLEFPVIRFDTPLQATIEGVAIRGHAQGQAGWRQQLRGGPMQVFASSVHMTQTQIARKDQAWLHAVDFTLDARVDEHRRRDSPGLGLLQHLVAQLRLQGVTNTLAIDYRDPVPAWSFSPGAGTVVADLTLDHGILARGGSLALLLPVHARLQDGSENSGDADLRFSVDDGLRLQAAVPPIDVLRSDAKLDLRLPTRDLPLPPWDAQLRRIDGSATLHSRFDSLGWITPMLERLKGLELDGSGEVHAVVQIVDGTLAQGTSVTVDRADMHLVAFEHRVSGLAHAQADVVADERLGQRVRAKVTFDRFDIAAADAPTSALGAGGNLVVDLDAGGALDTLRDNIAVRMQFDDARLPDLRLFNRYLPAHGVELLAGTGTLAATMHMDAQKNTSGGRIRLDTQRSGLRVGDLAFTSDVAVDARLADAALGDMRFEAGGSTVSLRNARIDSPKGERDSAWWATLKLREGDISLSRPLLVRARGEATMRDIGFVLSLFSAKKDFPKWIARLLDAGEATVEGQLHLVEKEVVVDRVVASNDRFDVQARLRLGEGKPTGDLYARWGVLGLGIELKAGERDMRVVGAKKWFEAQPNYLPE